MILHHYKIFLRVIIVLTVLLGVFIFGLKSFAYDLDHTFPKTAALYLNSASIDISKARELAKWDVVILDMQAQFSSPYIFKKIREYNPKVVILAYTSAVEYPKYRINDIDPNRNGAWSLLGNGLKDQWYLKTHQGKEISFWEGNVAMNLNAKDERGVSYATYLSQFLKKTLLDSGLWDGLLFDTVWNDITWNNKEIDIDIDGIKDSETKINSGWKKGHEEFFRSLRNLAGTKYLILGNGVGEYSQYNNGRMFEGFPEYWEGEWRGSMERYYKETFQGYRPRVLILNSDTDNSGNFRDYQKVRFGLTSALLLDAYYNFDFGTQDRSHVWRYDEYEVGLGKPKTQPYNLASNIFNMAINGPLYFAPGVWRRDFEEGISIVNSTNEGKEVELYGEFEKIHGQQDPFTNDGKIVSSVYLDSEDGIVLLRPLLNIEDSNYINGAFIKVFGHRGNTKRTGFFTYDKKFPGGVKILHTDLNNDNYKEYIVAEKNYIQIYYSNKVIKCRMYPYGRHYSGTANIATGDLDGDGNIEIITGTENGGGPHVRVFNRHCNLINPGFFAYGKGYRGGVQLAIGDINQDGDDEIVVGAGVGGGPHIRIFNKDGKLLSPGFFAFNSSLRSGVQVGIGDINGDGKKEIITKMNDYNNRVKVFNHDGILLNEFDLSTAISSTRGLSQDVKKIPQLLISDMDSNGDDEILLGSLDVFGLSISQ